MIKISHVDLKYIDYGEMMMTKLCLIHVLCSCAI